ncbi:heat shock factor protein 1 isoform X3 [Canis lupus baileyi]|uniref:heat shock factor protein 1 isoform X3 n=1 Tax=Canis lupus familiaris TaxID=9615 RepID=UPI00004A5770|nr:heat shock factor protein 1 isoform X3 [Canis lupus familiaris]XP_025306520.1 heat shock factor protein 1 isoform X3 [Canis lupus dingo]XP_038411750.1 heat shock factor protein 1 isoform X3 [Canis lupus familiaris]XP_038541276.1 heat shock factor protein 1 isoform X3 [Canis lupus familiaris]|eukprot:XP_005628136.1 heat shock factor protein 1 isoform X3 [Canis lupus familiaris]
MDLPVGPGAAGPSNVPAFLTKLWTLVSDPDTDALICWSPSGNSFHVFDQGQFAKEVLPKYFKHNNMASFVRQLNMYGFRKVVHIEQGGLVKPERDDTEFQHPCFLRGQEQLLENIKRKVTSVSTLKNEDIKIRQDSVTKLLTDVQLMKGKQESMDSKLLAMKHENEALWREVASLRQKHAQQQKVVNKLIQFLISLVQSNRILGVKRKIPLMLNDGSSAHSMPKYGRQYSLEHIHGSGPYSAPSPAYSSSSLYSPDAVASSGPIISDITELAPSSPLASPGGSVDERPLSSSPVVRVKEEPPSPPRSPRVEEASPGHQSSVVEIPLSPTALIDSILRESEPAPAAPTTPLTDAGGRRPSPSPPPAPAPEKCLSVACLDKTELSDHLDAMDSNLDNLQTMLTSHGFSVDTSALLDLFSPSVTVPDMSLPDLDSSLASQIQELLSPQEPPRPLEAENSSPDSGKQLVHYTAQPLFLVDPGSVDMGSSDLPVLFELGEGSYFSEGDDYTDDPTISLLTGSEPPKAKDPTVS